MGGSRRESSAMLSRRLRLGWMARSVWWLIPVAGLLLVLFSSYSAFTYTQYPRSNGTAGELLPGTSTGQTFVSRFSGLAGIEVRAGKVATQGASLVLHLRDKPGDTSDLATATIPAGTRIRPGDWLSFSFPPLGNTRGRSFYFQVESPEGVVGNAFALSWWQVAEVGNPYNDGAAFSNGQRVHADLAFGLHYSPSPLELYGHVLATTVQSPAGGLILIVALLLLGAWPVLLYTLPRLTKAGSPIPKDKLWAWSLPFVLVVALANGLIYVYSIPAWQGPDEPAHFGYVALLDHYDLDDRRVQAAAPWTGKWESALTGVVNASLDHNNFTRYLIGYPTPGSAANTGDSLWWEVHQPAAYYWICAAVLRVGRALGLAPDPYTDAAGALLWVRGTSVIMSLGVVALAWVAGLLLGGSRYAWLRLLLPLTVALLPMHAFIVSMANNDILAELVCSALFVTLIALFRWPLGWRGAGLAALCIALSFVTRYTKDSAYQVLPVVALGLLAWLGRVILSVGRGRVVRWFNAGRARWGLKFTALLALVALLFVVGGLLSAFTRENFAAGWDIRYAAPPARAARVALRTAHAGDYVIQTGSSSQSIVAEQMLAPGTPQSFKATFSGWARLASPDIPRSTLAMLAIQREGKDLGTASAYLDPSGAWTPLTATANIAKGSTPVYLALVAYGGGSLVQYDDLSLKIDWTGAVWNDPAFPLTILNPSGEQDVVELRPSLARLLPLKARQAIDTAVNPQPFSKKQLTGYYASNEFQSFWGDFGWLSLPLPDSIYNSLEVLCAVALLGIILSLVRRWGSWAWQEWLALVTVTGLAMGTAGVYLVQLTTLAIQDLFAFPQGRYLFVAMIPLMWLLLYGLHAAWTGASWAVLKVARITGADNRRIQGPNESVLEEPPTSAGRPWAAWLWLNALWLFGAYCLLVLIAPYFYK